jgi:hypothetical protein
MPPPLGIAKYFEVRLDVGFGLVFDERGKGIAGTETLPVQYRFPSIPSEIQTPTNSSVGAIGQRIHSPSPSLEAVQVRPNRDHRVCVIT